MSLRNCKKSIVNQVRAVKQAVACSRFGSALLADSGSLRHLANKKKPFFKKLKLADGRRPYFHKFNSVDDPYFRAANVYVTSKNRDLCKDSLRAYYEYFQPKIPHEIYNLKLGDLNYDTSRQPVWALPFPWEGLSVEDKHNLLRYKFIEDSVNRSGAEHGCPAFGPVSDARLHSEATRICDLVDSLVKDGVNYGFRDPVVADMLFDTAGNFKWLVKSGNHRCPVFSALSYSEIVASISTIVSLSDLKDWPNVVNGLYTIPGAQQVFRCVFEGIAPPMPEVGTGSDRSGIELFTI